MSVIVKGMKMPIGCDGRGTSCPLLQWGSGSVYCPITHRPFDSIEDRFKYAKERPADCPLVEVPTPHGRLIEEPKAFDLDGLFYIEPHDFERIGEYFVAQVKEQPTIIESEEMNG